MGDQKRIPRVVITSFFFHSLSKTIFKTAELPSLVWCRFFLFLSYLFVRILLNSLDFWSSKTITSILLLSVVLLKAIHAMTFCTKFLLFVSICVPPNNPITACGATSFPGYHSFPKWAISSIGVGTMIWDNFSIFRTNCAIACGTLAYMLRGFLRMSRRGHGVRE